MLDALMEARFIDNANNRQVAPMLMKVTDKVVPVTVKRRGQRSAKFEARQATRC